MKNQDRTWRCKDSGGMEEEKSGEAVTELSTACSENVILGEMQFAISGFLWHKSALFCCPDKITLSAQSPQPLDFPRTDLSLTLWLAMV